MPTGQLGFFTMNPDGTIRADFKGHVSAQGVDLTATGPDLVGEHSKVLWRKDSPTGALVASVFGSSLGGDLNRVQIRADSPNGINQATIQADASNVPGDASTSARVFVQDRIATILDAAGRSDFIQGTGTGTSWHISDRFQSAASGSLASNAVVILTITHNLGLTPSQRLGAFMSGCTLDGGYGVFATWTMLEVLENTARIYIANPSTFNGVNAYWRGVVIYPAA